MKFTPTDPDLAKASAVLLEIIRQSPEQSCKGKIRLFKAFYFAHIYYLLDEGRFLTDWPIVRMPHGPGIDSFGPLIASLEVTKQVNVDTVPVGPYEAQQYSTGAARGETTLDESELKAICKAVGFIQQKTASQLSELTHEHSRSWNETDNGEELDLTRDLLSEEQAAEIRRRQDAAAQVVSAVFAVDN